MKTFKVILKKGYVGDFAFEWDLDGSKREEYNKFIEECIKDGTYGEEYEVNISFKEHPLFEQEINYKNHSYSFIMLDLKK